MSWPGTEEELLQVIYPKYPGSDPSYSTDSPHSYYIKRFYYHKLRIYIYNSNCVLGLLKGPGKDNFFKISKIEVILDNITPLKNKMP